MSKKILVVTGSARRNGNSDQLAQAFARGAQKAGHHVTLFSAAQKRIGGCLGCDLCWSQGRPCIQNDDMTEAYPLFQEADVLALAGGAAHPGVLLRAGGPVRGGGLGRVPQREISLHGI